MRIATFNINNVNRRLPSLLKWLKRSKPDIACLQELKSMDAAFPREAIEAAVKGVLVASIYAPNGNPQPGPKFDYKLAWLERLRRHAATLRKSGAPVVLAGDFNVAPTELDIYPTNSWDDDALIQPETRAAFRRLAGRSWTDALRETHPGERVYTFWHYTRKRWERDAGLRLDHLLLSPNLRGRLVGAGVDREVRGLPDASDHAPVWVELRE